MSNEMNTPWEARAMYDDPDDYQFREVVDSKEMLVGKLHHMVKPDVDNLQKFILDCMTGIIYKDDAQIIKITATKVYSATTRTAICVRPVLREQPIYIGGEYACD